MPANTGDMSPKAYFERGGDKFSFFVEDHGATHHHF